MNVILVANDNSKSGNFIQYKVEILNTVSNILFLRQMYPEFKYIFYVDETTKKYYSDLGVLSLFDEVNDTLLNRPYSIDKKTFWSYSKILALRATSAPCVVFDLDYRVFNDIRELGFFNYDVGCYSLENINGKYYYSKPEDCLEGIDVPKDFDFDHLSVNVSSLYFKDNDFKNLYCDWVINYMYEWSYVHQNDNKDYSDNIILFAEQYMLNQFIRKYNKRIAVMIENGQEEPLPSHGVSLGLNGHDYHKYVFHFGRLKTKFDKDSEKYKIELQTIVDYVKYKITDEEGLRIFNEINENGKYERYFR